MVTPAAKRHEKQYENNYHVADVVVHYHHKCEHDSVWDNALFLKKLPERHHKKREKIHHVEPYVVLIIEHSIAAECIYDAEYSANVRVELFLTGAEIYLRRDSRRHHFKHCENVHKVDDVSLVNKKHKQGVGACDKEEENAPQVHSSCIVKVKEHSVLACENILEVGEQRYHLL